MSEAFTCTCPKGDGVILALGDNKAANYTCPYCFRRLIWIGDVKTAAINRARDLARKQEAMKENE